LILYFWKYIRYSNWLSSGLAARKMGNTGSRSGCEWVVSAMPGDFIYVSTVSFFMTFIMILPYFFCQCITC
jgi:hypothetical protein